MTVSVSMKRLERRRFALLRERPGLFLMITLPSGEETGLQTDSLSTGEYEVGKSAGIGEGLQPPFETVSSNWVTDVGVVEVISLGLGVGESRIAVEESRIAVEESRIAGEESRIAGGGLTLGAG